MASTKKKVQSILVIDDDPVVVDVITEVLQNQEGYTVWWSETGAKGVEAMRGKRPDLLILDLDLPDVDGLAVCAEIRGFSKVPIVMLSACNEDEDKIAGLEGGADDYVGKPFNSKELLARVRSQLRRWYEWRGDEGPGAAGV